MNYRLFFLSAAALLMAGLLHAQTGVLDPDAASRQLPPLTGRSVLANQYSRTPAPQPAPGAPAAPAAPRRQRYYPVDSDSLRVDAAIDSVNTARSERPVAGTRRRGDHPVLFLVGDSTMRTEVAGNGDNGQWGWGYFLENYFDTDRITVENHALGGESTRSWFKNYLFPMLRAVRPGDWVIIQLGHNDQYGGREMNSGRFRGILPGTGKEYTEVILPGNGTRERVYTYGEYLRIYVDEIRAKGGQPLLLSLTSRSGRGPDGRMVPDRNTDAIRSIAQEKGVPFIDFNAAIRHKFDEVFDPAKVSYLFFSDGIHPSSFGAVINAETFVEELRKRPDIGLSACLLPEKHYSSPVRQAGKPVNFLFGDNPAGAKDFAKAVPRSAGPVDNRAQAGVSARTFLRDGSWNKIYDALQPGDRVLIRFHRDEKPINTGAAKGELPGNDDEKVVTTRESDGINEAVYSFGWYLRKYCLDAREKGAVPIILGDGSDECRAWEREAAEKVGAAYADTPRELKQILK
ncbi:MAG: rhamnogalacturonan acetylesterase [Bacteroidales bacterium]|nr:rhamnogalacturonan acetylesterase [Bacteroidales bacterium]